MAEIVDRSETRVACDTSGCCIGVNEVELGDTQRR
jgi:hypothetical protein